MSPNYPAVYLLVKKDDCYLFVMREHTSFMNGYYSLPAGRVEENETFRLGCAREALEEVGITVDPAKIKQVYVQHRYNATSEFRQWVDVFFEADEWLGEPRNVEFDKHSKIEWLPIESIDSAPIMDYQKYGIQQILAGESYGEFGWPTAK